MVHNCEISGGTLNHVLTTCSGKEARGSTAVGIVSFRSISRSATPLFYAAKISIIWLKHYIHKSSMYVVKVCPNDRLSAIYTKQYMQFDKRGRCPHHNAYGPTVQ